MQARSIGWEMVIAMARKKGPDSSSQASEPPLPDPGGNMLVSEPRRSNRYWRRSKGVLLRRMRKASTFGRRVAIGRHPDKARFTGGLALQEFDVPPTGSKQSTSRSTVRVESGNIVTVKGKCNKIWL